MKSRQLLQVRSCRATSAVLNKNRSVWEGIAGFAGLMGSVRDRLTRIGKLLSYQEEDRKGLTKNKARQRQETIDLTLTVAGQVKAWAYLRGDDVANVRMSLTQSSLIDLHSKLPDHLRSIHEIATRALAKGAGEFGLTQANLDKLGKRIAALEELNVAPQLAGVERKTATSELADEINALTELLTEAVDPMMRQFKDGHPTFFSEYQNARRIGGRSTRDEKEETAPEGSASPAEDGEADISAVSAEADLIRRETGSTATAAQAGNGATPAAVLA